MMGFNEMFYNITVLLSSTIQWVCCFIFLNHVVQKRISKLCYNIIFPILFIVIIAMKVLDYIVISEIGVHNHDMALCRILCELLELILTYVFIFAAYKVSATNVVSIVLPLRLLCVANTVHIISRFLARDNKSWVITLLCAIIIDTLFIIALHYVRILVNEYEITYQKRDIPIAITSFIISLATLMFLNGLLLYMNHVSWDELVFVFISVIAVVLMDTLIIKLALRTARYNRFQKETELKLIGKSLEQQYVDSIKEHDETFRRMRHDFKHHMCVIDALLSENQVDEAKAYLQKYLETTSATAYIKTENEYLNAIVNSKISLARENDISVTTVVIGNAGGIDHIDLCTLLGNLFDNAIEGCADTKKKSIVFKIFEEEYVIRISLSNSIDESVLDKNTELSTTKSDTKNHGFGTKSIKEIANKYNGVVDYFEENNKFFANITLVKES